MKSEVKLTPEQIKRAIQTSDADAANSDAMNKGMQSLMENCRQESAKINRCKQELFSSCVIALDTTQEELDMAGKRIEIIPAEKVARIVDKAKPGGKPA